MWPRSGSSQAYAGHASTINWLEWNNEGTQLASASDDNTARVWQVHSGDTLSALTTLKAHERKVVQLAWNPADPNGLATASWDGTVRIWDVRQKKEAATIVCKGEIINICWSPDGSFIVVGNKKDLLSWIDCAASSVASEIKLDTETNEIRFNTRGDLFYTTSGTGCVEVYTSTPPNAGALEKVVSLRAHSASCYCLAVAPDGNYFAIGSADSTATIWDANEMICERVLSEFDSPLRALSFSCDSAFVAAGSSERNISVWSLQSGARVAKLPIPGVINSLAFHPKRARLLAYAMKSDRGGQDLFLWRPHDP